VNVPGYNHIARRRRNLSDEPGELSAQLDPRGRELCLS
jgi:hypothetical protein